jgi:putative phosphoribosyl transferase
MNAESTQSESEVRIACPGAVLHGDLTIPADATGLVVFAHGSGSSRKSSRNRWVAEEMHHRRLATLLFDLLTPEEALAEAETGALRFHIPLLTERLMSAVRWASHDEETMSLGVGVFGASTGAAAAITAASRMPEIQAVVSRGGRTDLSGDAIDLVIAPTLLIVGDLDYPVMKWNEESFERLQGIRHLARIHGATHLFEEPGTLHQVASLAASWFNHYLRPIRKEGFSTS